ncbi:MAG: PDZ domain-containing protein [Tepidisphaeraceae bacterium]
MLMLLARMALGQATQPAAEDGALHDFYERVRPALVVVQYQWDSELAKRQITGCGIVVREDGLVMVPLQLASTEIPDSQMKDFKIILPSDTQDQTEIDATFEGRDERSESAFIKVSPKDTHKWTAIHFEEAPLSVGQTVYGIGLLPKSAGYKAFLTQAVVSANLRGEIPQVMVSGGLANVGSPVFDSQFRAVGIVQPQANEDTLLDSRDDLRDILLPPHFFVPTRFYGLSLADPPTGGHSEQIPWMGVPAMTGVNDQLAEFLGLKNQPAVQIADVVPGTPADKAGLQPGSIVVKVNGMPLERGDLPEELPLILHRQLMRMKVGSQVTLTVIPANGAPAKGIPTKDIVLTLEPRPKEPAEAARFFALDLGFVVREAVFIDDYQHKMKPDTTGVVVDLIRRDGAAATAKLATDDWVVQLNGQPMADLAQFKQEYQAFRKDHPRDEIVLVVHRSGGTEETINIEPPQTAASPGGPGGDQP